MRFIISVDANWRATVTCENTGQTWKREMRKAADGKGGFFPHPPLEDMPPQPPPPDAADAEATQEYTHYDLCNGNAEAFRKIYDRITNRTHQGGDIGKFGRYLFDTLIGPAIWGEILLLAKEAEYIELALSWPRNEYDLHRLTWEMMRGTDGFFLISGLASGVPKTVAITRLVAGTKEIKGLNTKFPPRLLFIIGTSLTDTQIRPGAEYMNLIKQLKFNEQSFHHKVLQRATPQQMIDEMKAFEPDIVHFICHGGMDPKTNRGYLNLELDAAEKASEGVQDELKQRDAEQLLLLLKSAGKPPAIVVLSACYSGGGNKKGKMLGGYESAPLAAELVEGGIPVVVGMSGQISDLACRLFTRQFGTALVSGEQLVKAASEGRCAAFTKGQPPQSSVDWAFPTVFMAEGVEPDYAPVPSTALNTVLLVNNWIKDYKIERTPVFCSREEFIEAYYRLFKPHEPKVLAAYTTSAGSGYGKTRLLQQLAIMALREGHIPCLISSELNIWEPPQNVAQLCLEILKAISVARRALGLSPPLQSVLLKSLRFELGNHPADYPDMQKKVDNIREIFKDQPQLCFDKITAALGNLKDILKPEDVRAALQEDLKSLLVEAREKHPETVSKSGRVIVLLDEVHRYDKALTPLFYGLLEDSGLGTSDEPVPVVMALSKATVADPIITDVQETMRARVRFLPIQLFGDDEYMLVYQHVLMNPFAPEFYPGISDKAWVFDYQAEDKIVNTYRDRLRRRLQGIPADFGKELFYGIIEAASAKDQAFAVEADDELILNARKS